jgi:hypothetical protein
MKPIILELDGKDYDITQYPSFYASFSAAIKKIFDKFKCKLCESQILASLYVSPDHDKLVATFVPDWNVYQVLIEGHCVPAYHQQIFDIIIGKEYAKEHLILPLGKSPSIQEEYRQIIIYPGSAELKRFPDGW